MKLFCLLAIAGTALANEARPPSPPWRELWVPQAQAPAALKNLPRAVLLTREQYETLRRDAQAPPESSAEEPPASVVFRSLTMTAQPAGEIVIARAEMSVDVLSSTPAVLPLQFEPAVLAALELDETSTLAVAGSSQENKEAKPAALHGVLLPPGRHVLKATLHLPAPVSAAGRTISVRGSPAGASSFSLTLPAADRVESALTWSTRPGAEGTAVHTFTLPPGDQPQAITWSTRDIRDLPGTALVQSCDCVYTIDSVRLHAELGLQLRSRLAAMADTLVVPVPPEARVLSVEGPDVLTWTLSPDKTAVTVALTPQPGRHAAAIRVSLDLPVPAPDGDKVKPRAVTLPLPQVAGVHRASGRFVILTDGDLRVRQVIPPPLAVQNTPSAEDLAVLSGDFVGMWNFAAITAPPRIEIEDLPPVFHATQDTQIDLKREAVHISRHLNVVPRRGRLFAVQLTLPPGEELISVTRKDGAPVDWRKLSGDVAAGTVMEVRFPSGLKPGDQPAMLVISRLDPPNWGALAESGIDITFARAAVAGADKLSGFVAVSAEDRFALTTAAPAGLEQRDPAALGDDVPVRGSFVWFAPGDFKLPLHISARNAEFDVQVAAFALPLLHSVEIEGTLDLAIRQSGLRQLTLQLPPALAPFLRFDTALVSGTKLNAASGEWTVAFREELRGAQSLRWRMALPVNAMAAPDKSAPEALREFSAEIPVLRVPAARRTTAHWVMEANTDTELSFAATGLDERDTLTLPAVAGYTPRHRVIAAWVARGADWQLRLTARRHQPAALPALVVDRYELTTSVSTDGTLRHNALLTVRSNGQQFLDLPLPDKARILTLLVNGAPQKPAASGSAALRAQLPAGAVAAIKVSITWEAPGESWDSGPGDRRIEPMRLPEDIPVLESNWTIRLPDEFVYSDFRTDMQRENGPPQPEFRLPQLVKSERAASARTASAGGGATVFKINQSSAPDVFGINTVDARSTMSGNWLETQFKSITSRETLSRVVRNLKLDNEWSLSEEAAAEELDRIVEAKLEPGTEVVTINVRHANPAQSAKIGKEVMEAYEARRKTIEEERTRRLSENVVRQINLQEAAVEKARLEMIDLMKRHDIVGLVPLATGRQPASGNIPNISTMELQIPDGAGEKPKDRVTEQQNQSEYATAKSKYESQILLLHRIKEHSMKQNVDEGVIKSAVELIAAGDTAGARGIAGLLPLEIALPGAGSQFHFRGHHAPGAMTFSVRSIRQESRVAWLWIAAGMAAAGWLARRRPVFHGLMAGLLLWLVPWIAETGMGVCHRLLIGWIAGCGFILCFRILSRMRGERAVALPAPATVAGAALMAVLLLTNSQADAVETVAPADAPAIVVPYDPAKPLAEQNPQQVYVDYEQFQRLWQAARDRRLARNEPAAPALSGQSAAIISALYEASLAGGVLKIDAIFTVHTTGEWAALALKEGDAAAPFAGASIAGLTVDGKAAVLKDGALLVEKPGRHVLRATLQAPLRGDWRNFEMRLPRAPATLVSLTHTDASLRLRLNGGMPLEVVEKRENGYQWRGTGALGTAASLRMERLPAVTLAAGSEKPPLSSVRARLFVTPAVERLDSRIDFAFPGAERRDFSFAFDNALTPVQIDIPNLESWSVRDMAEGRRVLDFRLSVPARENLTAGFLAERSAAAKAGDERAAPAIVPVANRQEYTLEILNSDDLDVVIRANNGWARSELQGMGDTAETGFRSAGAYRLAGAWKPLTWTAGARPLRRSAQADYAWKISAGILETTVTFTLRAGEHEDLSSLTIPLPPGAALQTLDGQRLKDWWRAGDSLELRFAGATAETTTVWLDFTQPVTDEHMKSGLPLPCLTLAGFDDVKGRAVLATGPETDARLRLDDRAVFVREVEAERARGDYIFLPPLQVRRGFTFETPVFHATALLEPVTPQFAVRWVLGAAVQDTWTETQFRVDVEMRQGALPEVRFVMPAGMPEARVSGENVRETVRTALADGRMEYRAAFQSPVADAAALTISVELPHKGGIALPDIDFPGAVLTERFLIMQNFSAGEIVPDMTASSGVEPLARDTMGELHFTVQGFSNPLSWRLQPGWKLAAEHRALETTSGPQAVVLWAELTTMLRAEGPEWLRAVYHLQNRALQFLPLRLPADLELVSAIVAGTPVRADTGTLPDGKPGLLIPLIQTRPGDLAMDVEIVCRVRNAFAVRGSRARTLEDPDIPGVSIQRTLWNVWTPPGWDLDDAGGNMERVEEKKGFMEKLDASFDELESLGSYSRTSRNAAFRANAWQQSDVLIDRMEQTVNEAESSRSMAYYERGEGREELQKARERLEQAKIVRSKLLQLGGTEDARQTSAQLNTSGDIWQWDFNSSYLIQRDRDSGSTKDRTESIIAGNQLLNGGVLSGNSVILSKNTPDNAPAELRKPAPPPASRRYNAQIAALNEEDDGQDRIAGLKVDGQSVQKPGASSSGKEAKGEAGDQRELAQSAFNDVRGASRRRIVPPTQAPSAETTPPAGLLPAPAVPPATPQQAIREVPEATPVAAPPPPAPPVLKPAGRVSIPVFLPEEGTVHRFRKVNDRASLSLTIKPLSRSTSSRWLAAGVLAAGMGVLWLVNRKGQKRSTRQAGSARTI